MKTPDLKPCPFCGGKNLLITQMQDPLFAGMYPAEVLCIDCDAAVTFAYVSDANSAKQMAIEAWNRRVSDADAT